MSHAILPPICRVVSHENSPLSGQTPMMPFWTGRSRKKINQPVPAMAWRSTMVDEVTSTHSNSESMRHKVAVPSCSLHRHELIGVLTNPSPRCHVSNAFHTFPSERLDAVPITLSEILQCGTCIQGTSSSGNPISCEGANRSGGVHGCAKQLANAVELPCVNRGTTHSPNSMPYLTFLRLGNWQFMDGFGYQRVPGRQNAKNSAK